jgi:hypothetical protein
MKQDVHYITGIPRKPLPDGIVLEGAVIAT